MNKIKIIFLSFIIYSLSSCANPVPPDGGPPDKTLPKILKTYPENGTLNFSEKTVKLKFDKYMDKNSVIENVSVSPSKKTEFDWSGKEINIKFTEPLDSNTTYALSLGTDYRDILGNKPDQSYTLIFSTGNKIDSGSINGILYDNPSGNYIFAYRIDNINPDTLDPRHTLPHYKTQVGSTGKFQFRALKEGKYRLFAIKDQFKDGIYNEGIDGFGAASEDVIVKKDSVPNIRLKLGPIIDKTGPMLYDCEAVNKRMIKVKFNKPIDTSSVSIYYFALTDSAEITKYNILTAYISPQSPNVVELVTKESFLNSNKKLKLKIVFDNERSIADTSGNLIQDSARQTFFFSSDENIQTKPYLISTPFHDSTLGVPPDKIFKFLFNTGLKIDNMSEKLSLKVYPSGFKVDCQIYWKNDNYIYLVPDNNLASDSWYEVDFTSDSNVKTYLGLSLKDTTYKLRFKTQDIRNNGGMRGIFKDSTNSGNPFIIIAKSIDHLYQFQTKIEPNGFWEFKQIPPGTYKFEVYSDNNNNGKYDYGTPFPFRFSENFGLYDKEYTVKPRWTVDGIYIVYIK